MTAKTKKPAREYTLKHPPAVIPSNDRSAAPLPPSPFVVMDGVDLSKFERRNLPRIVKPDEVPVGGMIIGKIVRIVPSPVTTIKGKLIWLTLNDGQEILFPLTGTIRTALDEDPSKETGKLFVAKRQADGASKKFGGNRMFMFEVFTSKP